MSEIEIKLVLPTDEEAIKYIDNMVQTTAMTGAHATNVLALRGWLEKLKGRLNYIATEGAAQKQPVDQHPDSNPHVPETPDGIGPVGPGED
jgi:hypothetical protein